MKIKSISGNDLYALSFLETCLREFETVSQPVVDLPPTMQRQVADVFAAYRDSFSQLQLAREKEQRLRAGKRELEDRLRSLLRHVFQNVRRKLNHPNMSSATLNHFGLDAEGRLGKNRERLRQPVLLARIALEANQQAAEYGFDFMQDPSTATIEAVISELVNCYRLLQVAISETRNVFERLQDLRFEARTLQMMVCNYIKALLRGRDETYRRNVLRAYGFQLESTGSTGSSAEAPSDAPGDVPADASDDFADDAEDDFAGFDDDFEDDAVLAEDAESFAVARDADARLADNARLAEADAVFDDLFDAQDDDFEGPAGLNGSVVYQPVSRQDRTQWPSNARAARTLQRPESIRPNSRSTAISRQMHVPKARAV